MTHTNTPNILLISTDQQRADHLGCYGARVLRTPHIDSLAAQGTRYENAYVASPVCMPNRASLATSRMPSLHGVRHNGINLDLASVTFAELLRQAGWHTSLSGKPHFQCVTRNPATLSNRSATTAVTEAVRQQPGRYDQESCGSWERHAEGAFELPYYGFESVDFVAGHGDQVHGDYTRWAEQQGCSLDVSAGPENALPGMHRDTLQAWRTAVPEHCYPTHYIGEKTIEKLELYAQSSSPFCHWMSFCDPHHPFTPPGKYWDLYSPESVDIPDSFHTDHSGFAGTLERLRKAGLANQGSTAAINVNEHEIRSAIALTYGMITLIDDTIGKVLRKLDSLGLADNTIVIFVSDHGDLMGEHGLMFKGPFHFQPLIKVPLIWFDPRYPETTINSDYVSAIDIPATILNAAGVDPAQGMQGRPFKNRSGCCQTQRDCILIEDEIQGVLPDTAIRGRARTLLQDEWRMTIFDGLEEGELYNLQDDPMELNNCWNDVKHAETRARLTERLLREMLSHTETSPLPEFAA